MEWNMMEPIGASFILGDVIDNTYVPADDCQEVLEEMLNFLLNDDPRTGSFRRRLALEKVIEKDIVPLIKTTQDANVFNLAVRFFANLTQPPDICTPGSRPQNGAICSDIENLITAAKNQCTDVAFFKAVSKVMKEILEKESLANEDTQCLNHCVLLLRNLLHMKSGVPLNEQTSIAHQCLLSSFFMNEMDKIIMTMLQHKWKEAWTIGMAQLISFIFKDYSSSLLEPDIEDSSSASSSDEPQDLMDILTSATVDTNRTGSTSRDLSSKFNDKLQICSTLGGSSRSPGDDDFTLEFNSTEDGQLEIKLTKCSQLDMGEDMEECDNSQASGQSISGSNSSLNSDNNGKEGELKSDYLLLPGSVEKEIMSSINSSSCLMDMDIFVSYLKKFATDIVYFGLVDLVENIMKALLTKYESVLDHSFLIWTVGFFLSFAHQQELEFANYKEILNLDLFGYLVYEGVKSSESLVVQHQQQKDCSVEKHRIHLVVCTLNQILRSLLANSKSHQAFDYLQNLQKCLSHMTDLHNLFVLLIRHHIAAEQSVMYLRDLVQTNHMLMLMVEEWIAQRFIGENTNFSMLSHVSQFATKPIMAKYGSLLEHQDVNRETLNIAVLTMMYHVAGDCKAQDTLMQVPILKAFSELWMENAVQENSEFKDLVEFVLEIFMTDAEKDPTGCAQKLLSYPDMIQEATGMDCSCQEESSAASANALGEEEQVLVLNWVSEMQGHDDIPGVIFKRLKNHGFTHSREVVSNYLTDNNLVTSSSSSPNSSFMFSDPVSRPAKAPLPLHENKEILHLLSSVSEDNLIPFLLDKLRGQGFESHLVWLQKQLLETAYIKLGIKEPAYRIHVEEPVSRYYALQGKSIPLVLWSDELQNALTDPYFQLLQQSLGLYTCDDTNIVHPRIPHYLTPALLVNKARQIGSIESLPVKFDVDTLKEGTDIDIGQDEPPSSSSHQKMDIFKPIGKLEFYWMSMIQKMNQGIGKGVGFKCDAQTWPQGLCSS